MHGEGEGSLTTKVLIPGDIRQKVLMPGGGGP